MHQHISSYEKHWMPADNGLLVSHPTCRECGTIKNISPDRAEKLGYFANVLAEMKGVHGKIALFKGADEAYTQGT